MAIELRVPAVGESITEVEIGAWLKTKGSPVQKDEPLVSLESEKATVELPSPETGVLSEILKQKGEVAKVGEVIARLEAGGATTTQPTVKPTEAEAKPAGQQAYVMPAAQRVLAERGLKAEQVPATGPGGRLLKEDVQRFQETQAKAPPLKESPGAEVKPPTSQAAEVATGSAARQEETVPMSRLRRTVAERLVEAHRNAALLTTFNEVDMSNVSNLRKEFGESFQQKYETKLGFMSFFVKACVDALKQFPVLNAEVRGNNIVYRNYYDIGVAVGSGKGLVVPVLRNTELMSFAEVEKAIGDLARRARDNKLTLEELRGGTFTISNGGVYGSMLSTPIVNPPQSGVLGMHAIQDRAVVREGQIVVRPIMYVALTYDHRIVDGREAVSFLKRVKDVIENPARMLIEI